MMTQVNFNFFQLLSKLFKIFLHSIQNGLAIKIALIGCKKKARFCKYPVETKRH